MPPLKAGEVLDGVNFAEDDDHDACTGVEGDSWLAGDGTSSNFTAAAATPKLLAATAAANLTTRFCRASWA